MAKTKVFTGRKKITIPVGEKQFSKDPLKYIDYYLTKCVGINNVNKLECAKLQKIYLGYQDILTKTRINNDTTNNNKIVINHAFRQVEFKKGFTVGNPIEYSMAIERKENDDLSVLTTYFNDCNKAGKDIDKYEDLYKFGYALQYIIPRTDDFNPEYEAPFELFNLKVGEAFKVYSADAKGSPLFDVVISSEIDENFQTQILYEVYFINQNDGYCYFMPYDYLGKRKEGISPEKQPEPYLPLIQYQLNKNMIGIVEVGMILGHALNLIESNQLDNLIDFVNSFIVFENVDTKSGWEKVVEEMRQTRTIRIKSTNSQLPAKVYTLKDSLEHGQINTIYNILKQEMYDIVACPQGSGNVTSGGDTGEARILGNGWESAQNQAKVDTTYTSVWERELLKKVFITCKLYQNNKLDTINANDIAIKYSINMSNNIYTKTQALVNLRAMNFPYQEALSICEITSDIHGIGKKWEALDKEVKEREKAEESEKTAIEETTIEDSVEEEAETTKVDEA